MVIYTSLLPTGGLTVNQGLVFIHSRYKEDQGLLEHEKLHQEQMKVTGTWLFWWKYLTDRNFRLASELACYKKQLGYGASPFTLADYLSKDYYLGINFSQAYELLTNKGN